MALTPDEMERIAAEERRKLEEEAYRAQVRQELLKQQRAPRNLPAIIAFLSLVMLFLTALAAGWFRRPVESPPLSKSEPPPTYAPSVTEVRPSGSDAPTSLQQRSRTEPISGNAIPAGIDALLSKWRDTLIHHDLDGHVSCYAPVVYVFYNRRNVTRMGVREDRSRALSTYPEIRKYTISDVQLESLTATRAVVTFDKEWDTAGRGRSAGAEKGRLTLERLNGDWKIVAEQEVRVYWQKH